MKIVNSCRFLALLLAMALAFSTITTQAQASGQTITEPVEWTQNSDSPDSSTSPGAFDFTEVLPDGLTSASGTGTEQDPFIITSGEQLAMFTAIVNNGEYVGDVWAPAASLTLANDIDLTGYGDEGGWIPIGSEDFPFAGTFDGGNYNITGLFINRPDANYQGLFGCIANGTVKNLTILGGSVTGNWFAGSLSGRIENSIIENSTASIEAAGKWYVGGIAGITLNCIIDDCTATGRSTGEGYVGGIAGYVDEGIIQSGISAGNVAGKWCVGGLAGVVIAGEVSNGHVSGNVTGDWYVGGISGYISANSTIQNDADMNAMVSGVEYVDRFVGYVERPTT